MSDWEASDDDVPKAAAAPAAPAPKKPVRSKWEGEDEEDDGPVSDWEAESSEEEEKPKAAPVAPPKKKGTLKQKLAEKEAAKAARAAEGDDDDEYDSDAVLDPREKARRDKERELAADLNNAAELFGSAALGGTSSKELDWLISAQPRTKEDFIEFSDRLIETIVRRHMDKPLYATFLEHHARALADPLRDVEVRKVASALTTLSNEKQKEQRDKASGKKKPKATAKPALGAAKPSSKIDTKIYDEALDDFGDDNFM
ncbi:translation initiation factor eIF3 subunit [Trametes versicolor FP-101664 SS1]|uniref:translation initiation factor eIF3 subunit n=1 Tax=Trametes versicolor (strain FP-101664) TaxID=717944 RepID=UPI0004621E6D|nr:translation initiation factor eIF3 subunit [Trametes versicolor FP-101664 SS1]EIW57682.1 translation initiation factor eIF3 subunit [Trametes versicolor FP-101664 SS1]